MASFEQAEKIANNAYTVLAARMAGIATPFVATALVWFGYQWLIGQFDSIKDTVKTNSTRIERLETGAAVSSTALQGHGYRIDTGAQRTTDLKQQIDKLEDKVDDRLDALTKSLNDINGSIIGLQTVISERVPKRDARAIPGQ